MINPLVVALGRVLRLVGISSPVDNLPRPKTPADPPSWRNTSPEVRPANPLPTDHDPV